MKKILLPLILLTGIIYSCTEARSQKEKAQSVNAVLGDESFVNKYGHAPGELTNEDLRIAVHLEYVENLLRSKNVDGLTTIQKETRLKMIELLHAYRKAGIFPRNYDHPNERRPCFIDKDGRICAVGYLVEKTAGRQAAESINKEYKYAEIFDMNSPLVDDWIASSGLTKEECAMIQPSYGGVYDESANTVSKGYGVSSSILSGLNFSIGTVNALQISKGTRTEGMAFAGLLCGAAQTVLGISKYPETMQDAWGRSYTNDREKTLSMINIGLGTTTMLLSTWNLISNRERRDKRTTWSLDSFEFNNRPGMAFTLVRKL